MRKAKRRVLSFILLLSMVLELCIGNGMIFSSNAETGTSGQNYYCREKISQLSNGQDMVTAYDAVVAQANEYQGGADFSAVYGVTLTLAESETVKNAVFCDHPEFFWTAGDFFSAGKNGLTLKPTYQTWSVALLTKGKEEMKQSTQKLLRMAALSDTMSQAEKYFALYQTWIGYVTYDEEVSDQTAYSAITKGKAVCAGYAKGFQYLLQLAGMEATYVPGYATAGSQGGGHAWNLVKVGGYYGYCDTTLDDQGSQPYFNKYCMCDSDMGSSYEFDEMGYSYPEILTKLIAKPSNTVTVKSNVTALGAVIPESIILAQNSPARITIIPDKGCAPVSIQDESGVLIPEDNKDGTWGIEILSVTKNTNISILCKKVTMSTKFEGCANSTTVNEGDSANIQPVLMDQYGNQLAGKKVTISCDTVANPVSKEGITDSEGKVKEQLTFAPGSYEVTVAYAGDEDYLPCSKVITVTVVPNVKYEAGDFLVYATKGGDLSFSDFTYSSEDNALTICSSTAITVEMKEGVRSTQERIVTEDALATLNITLGGISIDLSSVSASTSVEQTPLYSNADITNIMLIGSNTLIGAKDALSMISRGIYGAKKVYINGGTLIARGEDKGIYCNQSLTIWDCDVTSSSIRAAELVGYDSYFTLENETKPLQLVNSILEGGFYKVGNEEKNTIYGVDVSTRCVVKLVTKENEVWYQASNKFATQVTGGTPGVDYENQEDCLLIKTAVPMTISMSDQQAIEYRQIQVTSSEANLTLDNVHIDRTLSKASQTFRTISGIQGENCKLNLTLQGVNTIQGTEGSPYCYGITTVPLLGATNGDAIHIDGTGSLTVVSGKGETESCGIETTQLTMDGGYVTAQGADCLDGSATGIQVYKNMTVKNGVIKAIQNESKTRGCGALIGGDLTVSGGELWGSSKLSSEKELYGIVVMGMMSLSGGKINAVAGTSKSNTSVGVLCYSDLTMTGGSMDTKGEKAELDVYGLYVQNDLKVSGGAIVANAEESNTGSAEGVYQKNKGGSITIDGGTVKATAGKGASAFGVASYGAITVSKGELSGIAGTATNGDSVGINTEKTMNFTDGIVTGCSDAATKHSMGIFCSPSLMMKGGTIYGSSKNSEYGSGIYCYNLCSIEGGYVTALGTVAGINANVCNLSGGLYATGDKGANTVCGAVLGKGYSVIDSGNAQYPYGIHFDTSAAPESNAPANQTGESTVTSTPITVGASGVDTVTGAEVKFVTVQGMNLTVEYTKPENTKSATVVVPDTVIVNNRVCKVTAIAAGAFSKNKKVKKVVIGKNINKIGKNTFYGCKNLKKIQIKSKSLTKKSIGKNAFKGVNKKAVITVPKGMKKAYKKFLYKFGLSKTVKIK